MVDLSIRALTCRSLKCFTGTAATANAHITWLGSAPGRRRGNISPAGVVRIFRFAVTPSTFRNISIAIISTLRG